MFKFISQVLLVVFVLFILHISAIFAFALFWDSSKEIDYEKAVEILESTSIEQKKEVFNLCKNLISDAANGPQTTIRSNEIEFSSIPFDFIRIRKETCVFFLYKNPGKGVGFTISLEQENNYKMHWFNEYVSWERHEITL